MALDTRIPLGVEQVDFANPLALLMQTRQNTQDRATAAQDRQREIARQSTQDQQRNTEFNQNSELNSAKIAEFKLDDKGLTAPDSPKEWWNHACKNIRDAIRARTEL